MSREADIDGLVRVLDLQLGSDPLTIAYAILDSEWLLRHEFSVVRNFVRGLQEGLENE